MRVVPLALAALSLVGCHTRPAPAASAEASADLVPRELAVKCGESPAQLEALIRQGAARLARTRGIEMEPAVFATILHTSLPEGQYRRSCAPKVDTLVHTIMQERSTR
jgi:hypothetical protein